jgi:SAM-dependent methyltransferase
MGARYAARTRSLPGLPARKRAGVTEIHFDERIAATYDAVSADMFEPGVLGPTVDLLAALAGDGAALELAIGTGRVALPLSGRGVPVHGIELSPAMAARLQAKPGADRIDVTIGDMTTTTLDRSFDVVYLVFNTIMNLTTMDEQIACFANAAAHLEPGGCFVIEVVVPDVRRLAPGESRLVSDATDTHVCIDEFTDFVDQIMYSHHWWTDGSRVERFSAPFRYVWPAELDLMARLAGMSRRDRWSTWTREPFTSDSTSHVSVWEKLAH